MSLLKTVRLNKIVLEEGHYERGKWVVGGETVTPFKGTWQPAKGQVMDLLPEGKRSGENYICYAPISLSFTSADSDKDLPGTLIEYEGKRFEVIVASKWNNKIISHWELVCCRVKEGES